MPARLIFFFFFSLVCKIVNMRLAALNVRGLSNDPNKLTTLLTYLKSNQIDMAMLSESHITDDQIIRLTDRYPTLGFYSNAPRGNQLGVTAIILNFRKIPRESISIYYKDEIGRSLGIKCKIEGSKSFKHILGVYAPNADTDSVEFFNQLSETDGLLRADIVLGDFNKVEESVDRCPPRTEEPRVLRALRAIKEPRNLLDGWRDTYPDSHRYTFTSSNHLASTSRIDRIYITPRIMRKCYSWEITEAPHISDHRMCQSNITPEHKLKLGRDSDT